jgi:hypothetical protein
MSSLLEKPTSLEIGREDDSLIKHLLVRKIFVAKLQSQQGSSVSLRARLQSLP